MRVKVDWSANRRENYKDFKKKHPRLNVSFKDWKKIIVMFNESFRDYILETGDKVKLPNGFGEFTIKKKKRRMYRKFNGKEYLNLPVDWKKTMEKGKKIYELNHHTEGYFFGWIWGRRASMVKYNTMWRFKASRATSRLLAHYLKSNPKYQEIYKEWPSKY